MPASCHSAAVAVQVPVYVLAQDEEGQFQPGRCARWWLENSLRSFQVRSASSPAQALSGCAPVRL